MNNRTERELYERERRREVEISRNNASSSTALLLGIFVTAIVGLCAVFFALSQQNRNEAPTIQPPDINIDVPQPQAPQVQPPEVNVQPPEINVQPPDVNVPEVKAPEVNVPEVDVPEVRVPEVNVPDVRVNVPNPEVPTSEGGDTQ